MTVLSSSIIMPLRCVCREVEPSDGILYAMASPLKLTDKGKPVIIPLAAASQCVRLWNNRNKTTSSFGLLSFHPEFLGNKRSARMAFEGSGRFWRQCGSVCSNRPLPLRGGELFQSRGPETRVRFSEPVWHRLSISAAFETTVSVFNTARNSIIPATGGVVFCCPLPPPCQLPLVSAIGLAYSSFHLARIVDGRSFPGLSKSYTYLAS
jgi:hypothetical protein